jgi:hypothetical protein
VSETVLPRRAVRQPRPMLNPRGDCAACCLAGVLGWSDVGRVYAEIQGEVRAPSWEITRRNLWTAYSRGLVDRIIDTVPIWPEYASQMQRGMPAVASASEWFGYVRMAVEAGYYGLAEIAFSKSPTDPTDHEVLICGAREIRVPAGDGCSVRRDEILVSCSASHPDGQWVDVREFLRWGGYNVLLVRPVRTPGEG